MKVKKVIALSALLLSLSCPISIYTGSETLAVKPAPDEFTTYVKSVVSAAKKHKLYGYDSFWLGAPISKVMKWKEPDASSEEEGNTVFRYFEEHLEITFEDDKVVSIRKSSGLNSYINYKKLVKVLGSPHQEVKDYDYLSEVTYGIRDSTTNVLTFSNACSCNPGFFVTVSSKGALKEHL